MIIFMKRPVSGGALDGEPPFGLRNGSMVDVVSLINEWWIKLGLMDSKRSTPRVPLTVPWSAIS